MNSRGINLLRREVAGHQQFSPAQMTTEKLAEIADNIIVEVYALRILDQ
jgi:hypothetical protein